MKISQKLTATINGSGNVAVNGTVDVVNVEIRGSGNLTGKVDCDNVTATIKGSGDVKLSGDIKAHYTTVTGSGRVDKIRTPFRPSGTFPRKGAREKLPFIAMCDCSLSDKR